MLVYVINFRPGRLLRNAQPKLMDTLIQASKDGDDSKLHTFLSEEKLLVEEEELPDEEEVAYLVNITRFLIQQTWTNYLAFEQDDGKYMKIADRWCAGLLCKDISITNEVYAVHNVEFDRQVFSLRAFNISFNNVTRTFIYVLYNSE